MNDLSNTPKRPGPVDLILGLFPVADARIVSALSQQRDALERYLAENNLLTLSEVRELMDVFVPVGLPMDELRATG